MKDLKALKEQYDKLGKEIEKLESQKRWRVDGGDKYYYVDDCGDIMDATEVGGQLSTLRHQIGNYFETEEQAKSSSIYHTFNSLYFYSFPWMNYRVKHADLPDGAEYWIELESGGQWDDASDVADYWHNRVIYRWPKN